MARKDPADAVEWLEGLGDREREAAMLPVLEQWAKGLRKTAAAVEYAFENASQDAQESLFDDLLALKYGSALPFELELRMANGGGGKTHGRATFEAHKSGTNGRCSRESPTGQVWKNV